MESCYITYKEVGDSSTKISKVYQSILNQNEAFFEVRISRIRIKRKTYFILGRLYGAVYQPIIFKSKEAKFIHIYLYWLK